MVIGDDVDDDAENDDVDTDDDDNTDLSQWQIQRAPLRCPWNSRSECSRPRKGCSGLEPVIRHSNIETFTKLYILKDFFDLIYSIIQSYNLIYIYTFMTLNTHCLSTLGEGLLVT